MIKDGSDTEIEYVFFDRVNTLFLVYNLTTKTQSELSQDISKVKLSNLAFIRFDNQKINWKFFVLEADKTKLRRVQNSIEGDFSADVIY
jgi:hypothetical protein